MGLLKGAGQRLKGLFAEGGALDSLEAAQAWLDGDYRRGMALSERNRRRKRRPARHGREHELAHERSALPAFGQRHEFRHRSDAEY